MKEKVFYTEAAYIAGLIVLAFSVALMEAADFGMSMVVSPAYLIYLKISEYLSFYTFGMGEYTFQAILLIFTVVILERFRRYYLFSFVTAVIYGFILDFAMMLVAFIPIEAIHVRIISYAAGIIIGAAAIAMLFHTYISLEVYELFVKEFSEKYNIKISRVKTVYDCCSCVLAICMSFAFFGLFQFRGVKIGTVICALINGTLIGKFSELYDRRWKFKDKFNLRKYFC